VIGNRIDGNLHLLAGAHLRELRLLEIAHDPYVLHHGHQRGAYVDPVARFHRLAANSSAGGCADDAILQLVSASLSFDCATSLALR